MIYLTTPLVLEMGLLSSSAWAGVGQQQAFSFGVHMVRCNAGIRSSHNLSSKAASCLNVLPVGAFSRSLGKVAQQQGLVVLLDRALHDQLHFCAADACTLRTSIQAVHWMLHAWASTAAQCLAPNFSGSGCCVTH